MEEFSSLVNSIFIGEVAAVQSYGAFVRIPTISKQGLIHRSQVSSAAVDDVTEILSQGDKVYCKVISVKEGKIGLSMKHVNQGTGKDLDPNGVELQRDEQKRRELVPNSRKKIELDAVFNTTCSKCGVRGHMSRDCFKLPDGKTYDLLPEDDNDSGSLPSEKQQEPVPETTSRKVKKKKKEKKAKLCKEKKKKKLKKEKNHKSSLKNNSTPEDSQHFELENKLRNKSLKRLPSSSSAEMSHHRKRIKHSCSKN